MAGQGPCAGSAPEGDTGPPAVLASSRGDHPHRPRWPDRRGRSGRRTFPSCSFQLQVKKGTYSPRLYGAATVQFRDRKRKVDQPRFVAFLVPLAPGTRTVDWEGAQPCDVNAGATAERGAGRRRRTCRCRRARCSCTSVHALGQELRSLAGAHAAARCARPKSDPPEAGVAGADARRRVGRARRDRLGARLSRRRRRSPRISLKYASSSVVGRHRDLRRRRRHRQLAPAPAARNSTSLG